MKNDKEVKQQIGANIRVSSAILPFGCVSVEIVGDPITPDEVKPQISAYICPLTTGISNGENLFQYQSEIAYVSLDT